MYVIISFFKLLLTTQNYLMVVLIKSVVDISFKYVDQTVLIIDKTF